VQVAADGVPPVPVEVVEEARAMLLDVRPDGMRPMAKAFAEADLRDVLPRIQVPTLLLYGDADQRSPLEGVAHDLHAKIPGSRLVVLPGVGHQCDMEAPDRFNAEVRTFLQSPPS
jgi:pimeloyl-ACP methyl ester carboxylesterase